MLWSRAVRGRRARGGGVRAAKRLLGVRNRLSLAIPLLAGCCLSLLSGSAGAAPALLDGSGLQVIAQRQLDSRLLEATVPTAALPGPGKGRILLPAGYARHPTRRYPVLYLLHGTRGGAEDWTTVGEAEQTTAGLPLVVVMPDIALNHDGGGWCTNWPNGEYSWETFHVPQRIPFVDANLRTRANRAGRAIAGLSQGGFCSMSYPARHPDLFGTALAYSGAPDIAYDKEVAVGATAVINATEVGLDGEPPNSMFGDRVTNEINWAAHDPATLAGNLRSTRLFLWTGDGTPGPYDTDPSSLGGTPIEALVFQDNQAFQSRLASLGIPSFYDYYGGGTDSWPYWARDLRESIGPLMEGFDHPAPDPSTVTYTSADDTYGVYGWRVQMHRDAREFSTLEDAWCGGFSLAGSGSATVRTPACLRPGRGYRVTMTGTTAEAVDVTAARDLRRPARALEPLPAGHAAGHRGGDEGLPHARVDRLCSRSRALRYSGGD